MLTVPFKQVLFGVADLFGLDPESNLEQVQANSFVRSINRFVGLAWNKFPWEDLLVTEQRFYRPDYSEATTYAAGAEVYNPATDAYYRSLQNANTGNAVTEATWWEAATDLVPYVLLEQEGQTAIGSVVEITREDPALCRRSSTVPSRVSKDRIQLFGSVPTSVYIQFRLRPSVFTGTAWDGSKTYAAGDLIYRSTTGESYKALQASTNKAPETQAAYWSLVPFPAILADYVQRAAYAEALKIDGENDKAAFERAEAEGLLEEAMQVDSDQPGRKAGFTLNRE